MPELRNNMVGVVQTYGQEPPHSCNTCILEGTQVGVQMTNALGSNLSKLSTRDMMPGDVHCTNIQAEASILYMPMLYWRVHRS